MRRSRRVLQEDRRAAWIDAMSMWLPDDCWLWPFAVNDSGYGTFHVRGTNRIVRAHRAVYEQLVAPIPVGLQLDHLCRNRACVNPAHLEAVTQRTNLMRGLGPASANARKTHCSRGHPFSAENTYQHRGRRRCRTCDRMNDQIRRAFGFTKRSAAFWRTIPEELIRAQIEA